MRRRRAVPEKPRGGEFAEGGPRFADELTAGSRKFAIFEGCFQCRHCGPIFARSKSIPRARCEQHRGRKCRTHVCQHFWQKQVHSLLSQRRFARQ